MKYIYLFFVLFPFLLKGQIIIYEENLIFEYKLINGDSLIKSVRASKMPKYGREFEKMIGVLFDSLKCETIWQEIKYLIYMKVSACKYSQSYSQAFDCILAKTNEFIKNGYNW
ncbi:MAG TPA: hypothetical protein PK006_12285 [Saprospiraceae bacterium]|nr:hypothetical protein [Saprospiraceae bacterium]